MQATVSGFGLVSQANVFRVCDQPHPVVVKGIIDHCLRGELEPAHALLSQLLGQAREL